MPRFPQRHRTKACGNQGFHRQNNGRVRCVHVLAIILVAVRIPLKHIIHECMFPETLVQLKDLGVLTDFDLRRDKVTARLDIDATEESNQETKTHNKEQFDGPHTLSGQGSVENERIVVLSNTNNGWSFCICQVANKEKRQNTK